MSRWKKLRDALWDVSECFAPIALLIWSLSGSETAKLFATAWIVLFSTLILYVVSGYWLFKEPIILPPWRLLRDVPSAVLCVATLFAMWVCEIDTPVIALYGASYGVGMVTAWWIRRNQSKR